MGLTTLYYRPYTLSLPPNRPGHAVAQNDSRGPWSTAEVESA